MKKYTHFLFAAVVVAVMPLLMQSGSLASEVLIFALAAMGCNLLLGFTGLLSFGQGIFFGLGSYTVALLLTRWPVPMPLALLLAMVMGALGAAVVGWVAIRQRGTYFVMLTLAFAQMFYFIAYTATGLTGGDNGLMDIPRPNLSILGFDLWTLASPWQFYGFVSLIFLVVFWLLLKVSRSTFGRTLLAVRDNEERAAAIGYNLRLLKLQAFVISGAVTGLAGGAARHDDWPGSAVQRGVPHQRNDPGDDRDRGDGQPVCFAAGVGVLSAAGRLAVSVVAALAAAAGHCIDGREPLDAARSVGAERSGLESVARSSQTIG